MPARSVKHIQGAPHVHVDADCRIARFTRRSCSNGCAVNDAVDSTARERPLECSRIAYARLHNTYTRAIRAQSARNRRRLRACVKHDDIIAAFEQRLDNVHTDVPSATRDQDRHLS